MASLRIGDRAPDFSAETQSDRTISLAEFRDKQTVVLFFYPKDGTTICTQEACAFRDAYEDFVAAGAAVIGVSGDLLDEHRKFAAGHRLPFLLVSDADGALRKAFGVPKLLGIAPGRVTYVIDREGVIRHIFNSALFANRHVSEALETVRALGK